MFGCLGLTRGKFIFENLFYEGGFWVPFSPLGVNLNGLVLYNTDFVYKLLYGFMYFQLHVIK